MVGWSRFNAGLVIFIFASFSWAVKAAELTAVCENGSQWPLHKVARVVDGDTLKLMDGRTVRVLGLNAPEMYSNNGSAEPLSDKAKQALMGFINQEVRLRLGEVRLDKHNRLLAHIYDSKGNNIAARLLQQGLGFQVIQAPEAYGAECYGASEAIAKKKKLGVWALVDYQPISSDEQDSLRSGFVRVTGNVERITVVRNAAWIDLKGLVTLYIPSEARPFFHTELNSSLIGDKVEAQGWMVDRNSDKGKKKHIPKRWMLILTHPNMAEFSKIRGE